MTQTTKTVQLAVLSPPHREIRFNKLGVLRNDMPGLFDTILARLEEPAKQNPWGPEAREELREIALGRCRCRPGYVCPGCQEALAENQAEGDGR